MLAHPLHPVRRNPRACGWHRRDLRHVHAPGGGDLGVHRRSVPASAESGFGAHPAGRFAHPCRAGCPFTSAADLGPAAASDDGRLRGVVLRGSRLHAPRAGAAPDSPPAGAPAHSRPGDSGNSGSLRPDRLDLEEAIRTRHWFWIYQWTWYEWLGAIGPLVLLFLIVRMAHRRGESALALFGTA